MINEIANDWRLSILGKEILQNSVEFTDVENPPTSPTLDALSGYDYLALFIGADYCPHCKKFAATVVYSAPKLAGNNKCKVFFVSNDRTPEAFVASLVKTRGVDALTYDLERTKTLRDMFSLSTIPSLLILKNHAGEEPELVVNAREALAKDPEAVNFPWTGSDNATVAKPTAGGAVGSRDSISTWDRLWIHGDYGQWWELGHHVNPDKPGEMYMDEHAVRARAGLLNVVTWIAMMNVYFWREAVPVYILFPLVAWEFISSSIFGLTPLAPFGWGGTILAVLLHEKPLWKPAAPKRFAWMIGLTLSATCFTLYMFRHEFNVRPGLIVTVLMCNLATWMESACGFCFGCYIYNTWLVPMLGKEVCTECKL